MYNKKYTLGRAEDCIEQLREVSKEAGPNEQSVIQKAIELIQILADECKEQLSATSHKETGYIDKDRFNKLLDLPNYPIDKDLPNYPIDKDLLFNRWLDLPNYRRDIVFAEVYGRMSVADMWAQEIFFRYVLDSIKKFERRAE